MPFPQFDRQKLRILPLERRENKLRAGLDHVSPGTEPSPLPASVQEVIMETAERIRRARQLKAPIIVAFGAHTIKNGLGPVLADLAERGWIDHLATNGAGIIHDWEFSFLGQTSEDVRRYTAEGQFGIWQETGLNLNLAIVLGAADGLGYGESIGRLIETNGHQIPAREKLLEDISRAGKSIEAAEQAAAAADALATITRLELPFDHFLKVEHPWRKFSAQAAAHRLNIPFTAHPMIGHDIIYTHPANHCAAIGRAAQRDFLTYAHNVSRLEGGVYLSIGSAVMSPMIFEKSMSMSRNLAKRDQRPLNDFLITVVDLAKSTWDWNQGEPPADRPEYYLRDCKTFSRMGGQMRYATADNRDFLLALSRELRDN